MPREFSFFVSAKVRCAAASLAEQLLDLLGVRRGQLEVVGDAALELARLALQQVARGPVGKEIEARLELRDTSLKKVLASFDFRLAGLSAFRFEPIAQGIEAALETATASFSVDAVALKLAGG